MLKPYYRPDSTRIGILNNRADRGRRTLEFADIAAKDIQMDYLVTFGEYESIVTARLVELGIRLTDHQPGFQCEPNPPANHRQDNRPDLWQPGSPGRHG